MSKANEISGQPRIVKSSYNIRLDTDYAERIADLKHRYRSAQVKASVRVNAEKLLFNWELGRDLVLKKVDIQHSKLYQNCRDFPSPFALIPWRHHVEIISKCKSVDEAFYIRQDDRAGYESCCTGKLYQGGHV